MHKMCMDLLSGPFLLNLTTVAKRNLYFSWCLFLSDLYSLYSERQTVVFLKIIFTFFLFSLTAISSKLHILCNCEYVKFILKND